MSLQAPRALRFSLIVAAHIVVFSIAYALAFALRFDFNLTEAFRFSLLTTLPIVIGIKTVVFMVFQQYSGWWRYVGVKDLIQLTKAAGISSLLFVALGLFLLSALPNLQITIPRSVYLLDFINTILLLGGSRLSIRLVRQAMTDRMGLSPEGKARLLIIGAGDTAETLLREIEKNSNLSYFAVGILDDDPAKQGLRIHGIPVLGAVEDAPRVCDQYEIDEIIVAAPSASREQLRRIVDLCQAAGIKPKTLPALESVLSGRVSPNAIREVAIDDLLGRDEIKLDDDAIASFLQNKVVLVTGAGGSIGSEICRQVCRFAPKKLLMLEQAENPLFFIERELRKKYGESIELVPIIANVCHEERMEQIFSTYTPQVILHAAAHKHVPLMEANPGEAIKNNIFGTRNVARHADLHNAESFVMISTDKAVNPTSVMGTSKRVAELYVQAIAKHSETTFISVRFGNVLGSNGSVVPIFKEQIRRGGPVTVTHPKMERYFMTIPEATQLVLQAATNGASGQVFVLDMGEPVKIVDLARDLIRLSGFTTDEIEIVFTGMRPGEKLFEELSLNEEGIQKTEHAKIFIGQVARQTLEHLEKTLTPLPPLADTLEPDAIRTLLKSIVPEYSFTPPKEFEHLLRHTHRSDENVIDLLALQSRDATSNAR